MRIVFMGTPHFAVPSLEAIATRHEVVGVITAPDKPAGRGKKISESPVKVSASQLNIPVLQPKNLKDEDFQIELRELQAELFVVVAFRMLPESVWSMPPQGTINLHASLLPQYRGAAPINWAIINGEEKTGLTTFFIEREIDTGKIIDQVEMQIDVMETAGSLHDRMMDKGASLLLDTIGSIESGSVVPKTQSISTNQIKSAPKIFKEDCKIEWAKSRNEIFNLIRGLSPYPAAWTEVRINGSEPQSMKIFSSALSDGENDKLVPGKSKVHQEKIEVHCGDGILEITELQLAGKKRMPTSDFLRGQQNLESLEFLG